MKGLRISFIFICIGIVWAATAVAQKATDANEIIKKMTEAYATENELYVSGSGGIVRLPKGRVNDQQSAEDAFLESEYTFDKTVTFNLDFVRPEKFRFEWKRKAFTSDRPSVFWMEKGEKFTWKSREINGSSFAWDRVYGNDWAITYNTQGSMWSAGIFYGLLNGAVSERISIFREMKEAAIVREESINGRSCYVIFGWIYGEPWVLWVDKQVFVLRRYRAAFFVGETVAFRNKSEKEKKQVEIGELNIETTRFKSLIDKSSSIYKPVLREGDSGLPVESEPYNGALPPPFPGKIPR